MFLSVYSVAQSCLTLCDPMECSPSGSSVHGDSPGKNTGVGCHAPSPRDLRNPGTEPASPLSPTLAGRLFTTEPPGKPVLETLSYLLSGLGLVPLTSSPLGQAAFLSWSCNSHVLGFMEAHWLRKNGILEITNRIGTVTLSCSELTLLLLEGPPLPSYSSKATSGSPCPSHLLAASGGVRSLCELQARGLSLRALSPPPPFSMPTHLPYCGQWAGL